MIDSPYPGYDALAGFDHWDRRTQAVIRRRLDDIPPIAFFTRAEATLLEAVAARIIPQDDRPVAARVPIVPFIDEMLAEDDVDGYREPDMPWTRELWRLGLAGVDEASRASHGSAFVDLDDVARDAVLARVQAGDPAGAAWRRAPAKKFFQQLVRQIAAVYYAHPAAWSEIGWGGPASPRGYVRTGYGQRDPWEPAERRPAPATAIIRRRADGQATPSGAGGTTH
ncbi:MAG TPA: gluconate 2-dehydrogenase subunit 3 family protein [Thermomicrobiales bacterium]|nr:gluconate 2-dehydrogenase subunit 3 family protein [Thermomicrobiales bacterium]